jgi:NAD-dependent DNA ligase
MTPAQLEREVLVHRYLYYVEAAPILSDFVYDQIEREARAVLPEDNVVHKVGSCLPSSYPQDIIDEARRRMQRAYL